MFFIISFNSEWASNKSIEAMFHASHKFIDPLSSACSLKNETAFEMIVRAQIEEWNKEENPDDFIPSEEDSVSSQQMTHYFYPIFHLILYPFQPTLELLLNATNTCSTKFDTSSFTIGMEELRRPSKKSFCYIHCILSELDFVRSLIFFRFSEFCLTI